MYIVSDDAMELLLGGEFCQIFVAKKEEPKISIRKLYDFQFNYFSYQGFRKFYHKYLSKLFDNVKYIDSDSMLGRLLSKIK